MTAWLLLLFACTCKGDACPFSCSFFSVLDGVVFPVRAGELWPFVGDFFSGSRVIEGGAIFSSGFAVDEVIVFAMVVVMSSPPNSLQ